MLVCVCVCPCTSACVPVRRVVLGLRSKCLQGKHFLYCVISPDRFYYSQLVLSLMAQLGYHHPFNRHTGGKGRQGHTPCKSFTSVLHLFHDYNLAAREAEAVFIVSVYVPRWSSVVLSRKASIDVWQQFEISARITKETLHQLIWDSSKWKKCLSLVMKTLWAIGCEDRRSRTTEKRRQNKGNLDASL